MSVLTTYLVFIIAIQVCYSQIPSDSIKQLYDKVLSGYDARIRPAKDQNTTTDFSVILSPGIMINMDTTKQKLSVLTHFTFIWRDEFLVWNSTDYHDRQSVQLDVGDVWHPTILFGPTYDGNGVIGNDHDKVYVYSSGNVMWGTERLFDIICQMDVTYYPFDTQECEMSLYLIYETSSEVLLTLGNGGKPAFFKLENSEWTTPDGVQASLYRQSNFQMIIYKLKLKRRIAFLVFTSVIPLVLLFLLNTFVLLVPVCSGEKGSIAITFLLSFIVYISSISASLPSNSVQTPLVMVLMTIMLVQSSVILLIAVEQSRIYYHKDNTKMSRFLMYGISCCRHEHSLKENEAEGGQDHKEMQILDDSNVFKCLDKVLFFIAFMLSVGIVLIFVFIFKYKLVE